MSDEIAIRSIQHYMYCPHRWGLIEIGKVWAENFFVTKANLMHKRVHDPAEDYTLKGRKVYTALSVYNDLEQYNLYGVLDCLENYNDNFCIVEYKPTKPKQGDYREEDLMQIFAQKICVDYIFKSDCHVAIYYGDVKKRYNIAINEIYDKLDNQLKYILREMRADLKQGIIPPIRKGQNCSGCSMKDLCMPNVKQGAVFRKEVEKLSLQREIE